MIDPKKNGNRTLRVRYDSGAIFVGPAIITDEGDTLVLLGGASSLLVRRADGSLPLHVAAVETPPEDDGPCLDAALAVFDETIEDGGGKRLFLFDSGGGFLDEGLGPCTRLRPGIPVGSAPIPNLPGVWMDKDGNLLAVSGERRVRIWNNHDWMAEELDDDSGEPSAHGPYTRYSLQTVEEIPWKPASNDSTPIHEGSRTVHLPDVRSFGRLERDKWLAVKNLEESAELVEACKQYLKACDPTDPSGIGDQFDDHANCLACYGVNVGGELGDDRDKAKAGWIGHVRDQRRQAMLDELADVLQTVGNLITAFGITDEEVGRAMGDCLERNRRKGRL